LSGASLSRVWMFAAVLIAASAIGLFAAAALAQGPAVDNAQNRYVHEGVAGCAGSSCHGRLAPSGAVVRQNEIFTWQNEASPSGEHSRAWRVLAEPRAQAIADKLGIGPAQRAAECLGCHADPVPASLRGPKFQISDGVGCESCHGGSRQWVAAHYVVGATHAGNIARGMTALDNPAVRADVCLDCHYGSDQPGQFVTHEIMAAGHPRISFELDLFTTLQAHHTVDADYFERNKRAPAPIQVWALGQAKALDRALSLYSSPALGQDGVFPQLYFFDCHACHRRIFDERDARPQALANPGRPTPVGTPVFNDENIIMLTASAAYASPELAAQLEADSRAFHAALTEDRAAAVAAAAELRATAQDLAQAFAARRFSREDTFEILDSVLEGALTRYTDYAGSAQAVMAADTLLNSMVASGQVSGAAARAIRPDLEDAYGAVLDPNSYSPAAFRAEFQDVADAARRLR
jgi:hypothetical protein